MAGQFITESSKVQNIIKGFNLTKSLFVSSILTGDAHTGKKTLIRYLFPTIPFVDGGDQKNVQQHLENTQELVIINFEKLSNIENLDFENKRIIAISNFISNEKTIDSLFAFIYHMPSLMERPGDLPLLAEHFKKEIESNLMIEDGFTVDMEQLELQSNMHSLRRSLYHQAFVHSCDSRDIESILYGFFLKKLKGNSDYKKYLSLYEKPLIEAGLKKYVSQLKLSEILGINRNTLRKKIYELDIN